MTTFSGTVTVQTWLDEIYSRSPKPRLRDVIEFQLAGNVKDILRYVESRLGEDWVWNWRALEVALLGIEKELAEEGSQTTNTMGKVAVGLAAIAVGAAVTPIALVGVLGLIGFGAAGPVAGSLAAAIQSAFYGGAVTGGSLFAVLQSIAMGGAALTAVEAAAAGAGIAAAAGAAGTGIAAAGAAPSADAAPWPSTFEVSNRLIEEIRSA